MPMIIDRIRVVGREDEVVYEGPGEIIVGLDPADDSPLGRNIVLRIHDGDYHAQVDLTGLSEGAEWRYVLDPPEVGWDPEPDPSRVPEPGPPTALLRLDIPPGGARALREHLYQGYPDRQPQLGPMTFRDALEYASADLGELTPREADRIIAAGPNGAHGEWLRILSSRTPAARQRLIETMERDLFLEGERHAGRGRACAELYEQGLMREESVREAFSRLATGPEQEEYVWAFAAREELIRSTRSEFPYDPWGYGRLHPAGPSRWTPPEDPNEVTPSCPA